MSTTLFLSDVVSPDGTTYRKGDIFPHGGGYFRIVRDPKGVRGGCELTVEPSDEAAYERRPLHKRLSHGLNDAEAVLQKGRVIEVGGAWMQITTVSRFQNRSAGMTSTTYVGNGPRIPTADEAAKKGKKWEREQAARDEALAARVRETLTF